jgi:hypothetical protein
MNKKAVPIDGSRRGQRTGSLILYRTGLVGSNDTRDACSSFLAGSRRAWDQADLNRHHPG